MSAVTLEKKIVVDAQGNPLEVIIPYEQFVEFFEAYGLDLTDEEKEAIREAETDRVNGNSDAFVSLEDAKVELGCTE